MAVESDKFQFRRAIAGEPFNVRSLKLQCLSVN